MTTARIGVKKEIKNCIECDKFSSDNAAVEAAYSMATDYIRRSKMGRPMSTGLIRLVCNDLKEYWRGRDSDEIPEDITVKDCFYMSEGKRYDYKKHLLPQFAPARYLKDCTSRFVVDINGQNYEVSINVDYDKWDNYPNGGEVTFIATDDPETDFIEWDEEAYYQKEEANHRKRIEQAKWCLETGNQWHPDVVKELAETYHPVDDPDAKIGDSEWSTEEEERGYIQEDISRHERNLESLKGRDCLRAPFETKVFGQPTFIQNEIFPMRNGRVAMNLCTLETDWGDSGNVNILFICDEAGIPTEVWFEASCC
jgi:hypothetical protein